MPFVNDVKSEKEDLEMAKATPLPEEGSPSMLQDLPVWVNAPLLKGTTCYEPHSDVQNIMITGGAGFIASWVTRHLVLTYAGHYNIICLDKLDYCATLNNTSQLDGESNFSFYKGDITIPEDVQGCLKKHNIDTVLHFAAQTHVDLSFGNSYQFTQANIFGTHVLLECMKEHNIRRFIHVSTDEVYGEVRDGEDDLVEDSILVPTNPYAASKAAAEMLVISYIKSFNLPTIIVRSNNVYGPHQFPEKVIPKFALMLQRQQKLTLHGSGKNTRRYLYAGDAADAFDTVLHKGEIGHVYNVGSRDEVSNISLCAMLLELHGLPNDTEEDLYRYVKHTEDRPFNDHRYAVDGSKLRNLGWEQKTPFAEGLRTTVDWYREFGSLWWGDIESRLTPFPVVPKQETAKSEPQAVVPKPVLHDQAKVAKQNGVKRQRVDDEEIVPLTNGLKRRRDEEETAVMGAQIEAS